jgi:hypothetical protein
MSSRGCSCYHLESGLKGLSYEMSPPSGALGSWVQIPFKTCVYVCIARQQPVKQTFLLNHS